MKNLFLLSALILGAAIFLPVNVLAADGRSLEKQGYYMLLHHW